MGRIYILGSKDDTTWAGGVGELVTVPVMTVNDSAEIHDFVCTAFTSAPDDGRVVIDLDVIDPALALTIAMHIRLSVQDIRQRAFMPLLFVSCLPLQSFLRYGECSQLFLTAGTAFCSPEDVALEVQAVTGLTVANYVTAFLDKIHIRPDATIGRHSMANQWGADVLYRLVCQDTPAETDEIVKAKKKLYYKYVYLQTAGIQEALGNTGREDYHRGSMLLEASEKRILLVDDEAGRGWRDVLGKWMHLCRVFDVEDRRIAGYDDLRKDIREKIEKDYYDLYLLDLRLLGNEEDAVYDAAAFSGMKVLKKIKEQNRGNQVIVMTASNKAWNMKALIDAGADGYYIKESPEQQLPLSFSKANFESFKSDVVRALNQGYKRRLCRDMEQLAGAIQSSTRLAGDWADELVSILHSSLRQFLPAKTGPEFAFSYLNLYQAFEVLCRHYITEDGTDGWLIDNRYELKKYDTKTKGSEIKPLGRIIPGETKHPSIHDRLLGIYVELCKGEDVKFDSKNLWPAIWRRNAFVHNLEKESQYPENKKIYNEKGYRALFETLRKLLLPLL